MTGSLPRRTLNVIQRTEQTTETLAEVSPQPTAESQGSRCYFEYRVPGRPERYCKAVSYVKGLSTFVPDSNAPRGVHDEVAKAKAIVENGGVSQAGPYAQCLAPKETKGWKNCSAGRKKLLG